MLVLDRYRVWTHTLHDIRWHGAKSEITVVRCFGTVSAGLLNRHVVIDGEYYQLMIKNIKDVQSNQLIL